MRIDHPTQIPPLRQLWKQAFGDGDAFLDHYFSTAYAPDRCLCANEGDALAAALYWLDCEVDGRKIAYIYAVATEAEFRGRGICHKLMAKTHEILKNQGYSGTILVPGEPALEDFYAPMGYRSCTEIREVVCARGPEPAALRPIDGAEYARLRRELLPENAVIQEGASLSFLATQAEFYAGTHWLLAARREGECLYGLELLGDITAAPGILTALGCAQGQFRTPGPGRPFAMYRPLDAAPAPAYFAFAFD
ncbi:MAG: GNAT family N-acetyltransferase [Oscillospiraceae bacterium]|nr:GNAT family N-acetyltransferase [Oscillospiraceae bacterium]